MTASRDWTTYEAKPSGTDLISVGDDEIRNTKVDIRERAEVNHLWGTSTAVDGRHTVINCKDNTSDPATITGYGTFYTKTVDEIVEAFYIDSDGTVIQLTSGGFIAACALTGAQTIAGVKTFSSFPKTPSSAPTTDYQVANKLYVDTKTKKTLMWVIPGGAATGTNVSARIKLDYAFTINKAKAYAKTAPTGANMIFDINAGGTSIWASTQANRVKITAGANEDTDVTAFDTTTVTANIAMTLDIDQVGSSNTGADITVELDITA